MQDYIQLAEKNGVKLLDNGPCQFCGAVTTRGIHECIEIFNLSFQGSDYTDPDDHLFRFLIVDAHALQHPEIHGRWSNHFHLTRLHLIFKYKVKWTYQRSSKLSEYLNKYKSTRAEEYLTAPKVLERGEITSTEIKAKAEDVQECKKWIIKWAEEVYQVWSNNHPLVDFIAKGFLDHL